MTIQSGQNVVMSMAVESSYGNGDGSGNNPAGNWDIIPFNTASLTFAQANFESQQITGDREVHDVIMGGHSVSGDISFHLNNQASIVTMINAVLGDITSSNAVNSVGSTRSSYAIEQNFKDLGAGNDVHVFAGCEFNTFNMTIPADGLIECTVGVVGSTLSTFTATEGGTVAGIVDTVNPFHSSDVKITLDGGSTAETVITDLTLNIDNGISTTNSVGSKLPIQGGIGKCRVTGSLTAHFANTTLFDSFKTSTAKDLTIQFGANSGATSMLFDMSRILLTTGAVEVGGEGLLTVSCDFVAMRNDSNNQSTISIDTDLSG